MAVGADRVGGDGIALGRGRFAELGHDEALGPVACQHR
jgi:hypothetical protein